MGKNNKKLTTDEYKEQIKDRSVICIGDYINAHTKIDHQCKTCGYIWGGYPKHIKNGTGCPQCANKIRVNKRKNTTESYKEDIKNRPIICLEEYQGSNVKLKHQCTKCFNIWKTSPSNTKSGRGCPKCANKSRLYNSNYKKYKNHPTTFYLIQINDIIKPGVTRSSIEKRYHYDNIEYKVIQEITFVDGIDAFNLEQNILNSTTRYKLYSNSKNGPLRAGNTELRSIESLPFIFDILNPYLTFR